MSIPPRVESIASGAFALRSNTNDAYHSDTISDAPSIHTSCTVRPLMSMPRIAAACSRACASSAAILIPPSLPRPPTWTCALTAQGKPIATAAATASSTLRAARPSGTGIP